MCGKQQIFLPLCQMWDYNHCSQNKDHLHHPQEPDAHFASFFCEIFNMPNIISVILYILKNVKYK